jgi:agmatinase
MAHDDIDDLVAKAGGNLGFAGPLGFMRRPLAESAADAEAAILGVPFDIGVSNRSGTRLGPRAIREMSVYNLGQICPLDWFDERTVVDLGDTFFYPGDMRQALERIQEDAAAALASGAKLLALGGDHTISLPLIRAHAEHSGSGISLVHFDSHTDAYDFFDLPFHGSMFETLVDEGALDPSRSVQVGIRSATTGKGFGYTKIDAERCLDEGPAAVAEEIRRVVGDNLAYVTFDVDFLDPAYAPGTGTPVVGGPSSADARRILRGLRGLNVIGGDVVEVSPPFDTAGQTTALVGATIAFDVLDLMIA